MSDEVQCNARRSSDIQAVLTWCRMRRSSRTSSSSAMLAAERALCGGRCCVRSVLPLQCKMAFEAQVVRSLGPSAGCSTLLRRLDGVLDHPVSSAELQGVEWRSESYGLTDLRVYGSRLALIKIKLWPKDTFAFETKDH